MSLVMSLSIKLFFSEYSLEILILSLQSSNVYRYNYIGIIIIKYLLAFHYF